MTLKSCGEVKNENFSPSSPSRQDSSSSCDDGIKPCEGDLLVVKCMLGQVQNELDLTQENIFHIRCPIRNKVCSLIIDRESNANRSSTRVGISLA